MIPPGATISELHAAGHRTHRNQGGRDGGHHKVYFDLCGKSPLHRVRATRRSDWRAERNSLQFLSDALSTKRKENH